MGGFDICKHCVGGEVERWDDEGLFIGLRPCNSCGGHFITPLKRKVKPETTKRAIELAIKALKQNKRKKKVGKKNGKRNRNASMGPNSGGSDRRIKRRSTKGRLSGRIAC